MTDPNPQLFGANPLSSLRGS